MTEQEESIVAIFDVARVKLWEEIKKNPRPLKLSRATFDVMVEVVWDTLWLLRIVSNE